MTKTEMINELMNRQTLMEVYDEDNTIPQQVKGANEDRIYDLMEILDSIRDLEWRETETLLSD